MYDDYCFRCGVPPVLRPLVQRPAAARRDVNETPQGR